MEKGNDYPALGAFNVRRTLKLTYLFFFFHIVLNRLQYNLREQLICSFNSIVKLINQIIAHLLPPFVRKQINCR